MHSQHKNNYACSSFLAKSLQISHNEFAEDNITAVRAIIQNSVHFGPMPLFCDFQDSLNSSALKSHKMTMIQKLTK